MKSEFLGAAFACVLACGTIASAEVIGAGTGDTIEEPTTTNGGVTIAGWNNVGTVNGASGVYLGNDWVLTAAHVGGGNFTLNEGTGASPDNVTYTYAGTSVELSSPSSYAAATPDHNADLTVFKINDAAGLPSPVSLAGADVTSGEPMYSIGYGLTATSITPTSYYVYANDPAHPATTTYTWSTSAVPQQGTSNYQGFQEVGSNTKLWGNNLITNFNGSGQEPNDVRYGDLHDPVVLTVSVSGREVEGFASEFYTSAGDTGGTSEEQQIAAGDSGGGVFSATDQLIGINDATLNLNSQPTNTAIFGQGSLYSDLYAYENQIEFYTQVPEPGCAGILLVGMIAIGIRRRSPIGS